MLKRFALLVVLCSVITAYAGIYNTYNGTSTTATVDTNRVSARFSVKSGLMNGKQTNVTGVTGGVVISDISNPGDAAFGNVDTAIITYYTQFGNRKVIFEVDTVTTLPGTSLVWNDADSVWNYMDNFSVDYYLADSTEDYAGSDDTLACTLSYFFRLIED